MADNPTLPYHNEACANCGLPRDLHPGLEDPPRDSLHAVWGDRNGCRDFRRCDPPRAAYGAPPPSFPVDDEMCVCGYTFHYHRGELGHAFTRAPYCDWPPTNRLVDPTMPSRTRKRDTGLTAAQLDHMLRMRAEIADRVEAKYTMGAIEHKGLLTDKSPGYILNAAIEESLDLITYLLTLQEQMRALLVLHVMREAGWAVQIHTENEGGEYHRIVWTFIHRVSQRRVCGEGKTDAEAALNARAVAYSHIPWGGVKQ